MAKGKTDAEVMAEIEKENRKATETANKSLFTHDDISGAALSTARDAGMDPDATEPRANVMSPGRFAETDMQSPEQLQARIKMLEMERAEQGHNNERQQGNIQSLYALVRWLYDKHHRNTDLAAIIREHATDLAGSEVLDRSVVRTMPVISQGSAQPIGLVPAADRQYSEPMEIPSGAMRQLPGLQR